jgi:hypothetical protein
VNLAPTNLATFRHYPCHPCPVEQREHNLNIASTLRAVRRLEFTMKKWLNFPYGIFLSSSRVRALTFSFKTSFDIRARASMLWPSTVALFGCMKKVRALPRFLFHVFLFRNLTKNSSKQFNEPNVLHHLQMILIIIKPRTQSNRECSSLAFQISIE